MDQLIMSAFLEAARTATPTSGRFDMTIIKGFVEALPSFVSPNDLTLQALDTLSAIVFHTVLPIRTEVARAHAETLSPKPRPQPRTAARQKPTVSDVLDLL